MKLMYFLQIILISFIIVVVSASVEDRKVFIVYMGFLPEGEYSPSLHHLEILKNVTDPRFASKALIRSYTKSFNGFAANLTQEEQQKLVGYDGIISVFPCQKMHLHTTRSWDFMGFPTTTERSLAIESNIIIGVIDSGIWPESESFNDEGLGPIPEQWKGECLGGPNFTCNRKIIGARPYGMEDSVRDMNGHGTHVSAIIAGNHVHKASYYGLAQGTARGGVPSARLAVYKTCGEQSCDFRDILSAFDDAIDDGVDIISLSLAHDKPIEITYDPIAIGAFHAMQKGILTVQAAGNAGPGMYTVIGDAPWIFTVAASDTDRKLVNKVLLGDGTILVGSSINGFPSSHEEMPLVYGRQVTSTCSEIEASYCIARCLDNSLVEQKVVLCDGNINAEAVKAAGALGCILGNNGNNVSHIGPLPVGALNTNDLNLVRTYQNSTKKPKVQILKSEAKSNPDAPLVASFSSRGPSKFISDIIKPDVTAPGVEILAAYSPIGSPSETVTDKSSVKYSILSGTSMACPHVAAAAAFVKSFHRDWSPSAIKSALMTTAWEMNPNRSLHVEFSYGSGHIDPHKAKDPGLVYDTSLEDYHKISCSISQSIDPSCHDNLTLRELNYPSMAVQVDINSAFVVSFPRTVTNVGKAESTYVVSIHGSSSKLHITVDPEKLQFTALNQRKSFVVTVRGDGIESPLSTESVSLIWTDGIHKARSPIVVYTPTGNFNSTGNLNSTGNSNSNSTGNSNSTSIVGASTTAPTRCCKNFVIILVSMIIGHCVI